MKVLMEDMKNGVFKAVYLLYGEEEFLKKSYKNRLRESIVADDTMNYNAFEGKGIDIDEVISLADTMPFFQERRLILIENSGFFKQATDTLTEYLPNLPDSTILLFVENEVDKRGRLYKRVNEQGYVAEMKRQDSRQLAAWAGAMLKQEGRKISSVTMDYFLSKTGEDMSQIKNELEKLISYTMGRELITDEDIEAICSDQISNKIFDMVQAIVNRQKAKALDLYEDLLTLREPPMRILFLIARQFNQLLQVKDLLGRGMERNEIAAKLKLPPFVIGKTIPCTRAFTRAQIIDYVSLCVEMEEAVKTGRLSDRLAVELLITKEYGI